MFKNLFLGILAIILIGIGGLVYRNASEHPNEQIACPLDAKLCPDGTAVGRTGTSCTFPACPPPNVSLDSVGISYAVPDGFTETTSADASAVAAYLSSGTSTEPSSIIIRSYPLGASSTPLETIQATAIGGASGEPVPVTKFSSRTFGAYRFTVVSLERFEGYRPRGHRLDQPVTRCLLAPGAEGTPIPSVDLAGPVGHGRLMGSSSVRNNL